MKRIIAIATLPLLALAACGNDSDYQFFAAGPMLDEVKASPLLVAPKTMEATFATSLIGADTGGGTDPLKHDAANRATRLYGQFARNAKGSTPAGHWNGVPRARNNSTPSAANQSVRAKPSISPEW